MTNLTMRDLRAIMHLFHFTDGDEFRRFVDRQQVAADERDRTPR